MEQTLLWEHRQEVIVINQKGKGNIMDAGIAKGRQEDIKGFNQEPEKQDCLDDLSGKKITRGTPTKDTQS